MAETKPLPGTGENQPRGGWARVGEKAVPFLRLEAGDDVTEAESRLQIAPSPKGTLVVVVGQGETPVTVVGADDLLALIRENRTGRRTSAGSTLADLTPFLPPVLRVSETTPLERLVEEPLLYDLMDLGLRGIVVTAPLTSAIADATAEPSGTDARDIRLQIPLPGDTALVGVVPVEALGAYLAGGFRPAVREMGAVIGGGTGTRLDGQISWISASVVCARCGASNTLTSLDLDALPVCQNQLPPTGAHRLQLPARR